MTMRSSTSALCGQSVGVAIDLATAPHVTLSQDEVHVWSASLETSPRDIVHLVKTLDSRELHRAHQFRFVKDQNHFISARGLLRHILSLYVHQDPNLVEFCYNANGKPEIRHDSRTGKQGVRFNYSHSDVLAVYAFARHREVGIDVERIRPQVSEESIPEHFFCRSETAALRSLPASQRAEAFLQCWTRKEAYIKARGEGFRIPLDSFEVFPDPGWPVVITDNECAKWSLQSFVPTPGYAAALAAEGEYWRTRFIALRNPASDQTEQNHRLY
jgi:4'-phosphopantetheinyl transferase